MKKRVSNNAPVLLVQSGYDRKITRDPTSELPIGLGTMAAFCDGNGISVDIFDFQVQSDAEFAERIKAPELALVGFSAATLQIYRAGRIAMQVRKARPDVALLLGGIHPSALPEQTNKKFPVFDGVAVGEGEKLLLEYATAVLEGKKDFDLPGVWRLKNGEPVFGGARPLINDLDALPHPDRSLMHIDRYVPNFSAYRGRPGSGILGARGCPFRCLYCSVRKLYGGKFRAASPDWLVEDMRKCVRNHGIRDFLVYDDTFNVPKGRINRVCELIIREGLDISWSCYGRADELDEKTMRLMRSAGCFQIRFGFEVGSDERLTAIGKSKITLDKIRTTVAITHKVGIESYSNFMVGLPDETLDDARQTVEFARSLALDSFSFSTFYPYPGAPFTDELVKKGSLAPYLGLYPDFDLENLYENYAPNPDLTDEAGSKRRRDFEAMLKRGFIRCATNPRWILRKVAKLAREPIVTGRFMIRGIWRFVHRFLIGEKTR